MYELIVKNFSGYEEFYKYASIEEVSKKFLGRLISNELQRITIREVLDEGDAIEVRHVAEAMRMIKSQPLTIKVFINIFT